MTKPPICYQSEPAVVSFWRITQLDLSDSNGIKCFWTGNVANGQVILTWKFDWGELWGQGVDRLTGHILIKQNNAYVEPVKIEVKLTDTEQTITKSIVDPFPRKCAFEFEYSLTPQYAPRKKVSYDAIFAPSHMNDTVLVIEGKKINVNKTFLSYQSEYFEALFSKNFKEGSLSEIEIKEVSYDDFGLLCSSFFPNPQFPNDRTVEKLLEMGRRFLLPSVIATVEHHLLHISKIGFQKMIWLADEYQMPKLLEKCIRQMDSMEKAKKLKKLPEFEKLSDKTKALILGRILKFM
ncbi:hypothetical protein B9Z55_007665 [Caenorhabditis nigoni]|uniref:BTB domain-containing protein n=1 Tax=Caenorhabditis nigoni TaxID=1611254 RepID=A0A2G5VAL2_9PELO|nr:hypothetical protein B9Z55_007665 [Caenorhabditis nigoni]